MNNRSNYIFTPINEGIICYQPTTNLECMDHSLPYHRHGAYEIYVFLRGNTNMYLERSCYHLEHGDLMVISPNEMHRAVCLDTQIDERIGINIKKNNIGQVVQ